MTEQIEVPRLYSAAEVAAIMHVSPELAKRRMSSRRWPSVKPSRTRMMTAAQIQEALDIEATEALEPRRPPASGLSPLSRHIKRRPA